MESDPGYALQKLRLAIDILATGEGETKERMRSAYPSELHLIQDDDVPERLKNRWIGIRKAILGKGPRRNTSGEVYVSAIDNTLKRRWRRTVAKAASDMIDLECRLEGYLNE